MSLLLLLACSGNSGSGTPVGGTPFIERGTGEMT